MTESRKDPLEKLSDDEREALTQVLVTWRENGVESPTLPLYEDVDGDGTPDLVSLDENGTLVFVPGGTLEGSVSVSEGEVAE